MRIINVSVALVLALSVFLLYWFAIRPLPKTSGELRAPLRAAATVKRDARGVPHIEASSWQDAIFLQGFVTAQDRLWQMDSLRRFAAGELCEVFGRGALGADEGSRRLRMRAIAEADVLRLRPADRAVLAEYARGVNFFIETHRGRYSLEFTLPGHAYNPRPWTLADSVLVGLVMFRDLTDSWQFEVEKAVFLARSNDLARAQALFPAMQGQYASPGSNAWAVSGSHTEDGKPMAANDPHLAFGIPSTWHLVHLRAPGLNVSGAALPGVPSVITGHNEQIAWGVTNLQADVMDVYAEQLNPATGQYLYKGGVEQAQLDHESIGVRGEKPVELNVWVTRHGPVVTQAGGRSYALRWTAAEGFALPFFDIDRARNWDEFRNALRDFWGPGQNFVYADRAGNIGYQATGRVPIRRGFDGDVPLDGASGSFEWDGYIPFEEMPSLYNPPSGIIATSNQSPFAGDYQYRVTGSYADRYRVTQVRALLAASGKLNADKMLAVQKDVYSAYDKFLAQQVITAAAKRGGQGGAMHEAVEILRSWNGQMDKDSAAPMITQLLSNQLGTALVTTLLRPGLRQAPNIQPRPQVIETLLRTRPSGWVARDDWDGWLMNNLMQGLQDGRKRQGSPVARWKWGGLLQWNLTQPIGRQLPLVDVFFDIGPVPMSGSGTTIKQTTAGLGPSERMVADLGDWERSVQNLTVGESGHVASSHYKDEWSAYYVGKSFPMQFEHVDAKETLRIKPLPPRAAK